MTANFAIVAIIALAGAGRASTMAETQLIGNWGGDHVRLAVTAQGAQLMLDCGAGTFTLPTVIDRHGNFSAVGTWQLFNAGPSRADEAGAPPSASYRGSVAGDQLTLDVSTTSPPARHRYLLTRNSRTKLVRCL